MPELLLVEAEEHDRVRCDVGPCLSVESLAGILEAVVRRYPGRALPLRALSIGPRRQWLTRPLITAAGPPRAVSYVLILVPCCTLPRFRRQLRIDAVVEAHDWLPVLATMLATVSGLVKLDEGHSCAPLGVIA